MNESKSQPEQSYMPLREAVLSKLREDIITGRLKPGDRLLEVAIADELDVSRTPVREAIHKLEQERLVTFKPHRGAVVARITKKNMEDVLEVRKALEALAIELACQRMTAEDYSKLEAVQNKFKENIDTDDALLLADMDEKFHGIIYSSTRNDSLIQILANLREQIYRYRLEYIREKDKRKMLMLEHDMLIKALVLRHVEEAKQTARQHIDNQQLTILRSIKAH